VSARLGSIASAWFESVTRRRSIAPAPLVGLPFTRGPRRDSSVNSRLPPIVGEWIARDLTLSFRFEGTSYEGYAGDVVTSALWANGLRVLGRSYKYHRPRGVLSLADQDVNALAEDAARMNLRCDVTPLSAAMDLRAVNTLGGVRRDRLRMLDRFSALAPVGFDSKSFHSRAWAGRAFEQVFRQLSGLGRVELARKREHVRKEHASCDVLVVGAGPAGLAAGIAAAESGASVWIVDENARAGGSLGYARGGDDARFAQLSALLDRIAKLERIQLRPSTVAAGYYADHLVPLIAPDCTTKLRARAVVVASGALEQPAVFGDNDLPGVMLGSAAQRLIYRYAVQPMRRAVVLAANLEGYRVALDLMRAGVKVAAIADLRPEGAPANARSAGVSVHSPPEVAPPISRLEAARAVTPQEIAFADTWPEGLPAVKPSADDMHRPHVAHPMGSNPQAESDALIHRLTAAGVPIFAGHCIREAIGRRDRVVAAVLAPAAGSGKTRRIACDGIVMSVGFAPNASLLHQAGARLEYSEELSQFVPLEMPPGVFAAGRVNGVFDVASELIDGERAGRAAAAYLNLCERAEPLDSRVLRAVRTGASPTHASTVSPSDGGKCFVDFDRDVLLEDVEHAARAGFDSVELMKRYARLGIGPSQGKHSMPNAVRILARARGLRVPEIGTPTARPFYQPVSLAHLAGLSAYPVRRTALHARHEASSAHFFRAGDWLRPEYYAKPGVTSAACIRDEVRAVRSAVGLIDVGTLGKLELFGKDTAEFLERVYTGRFHDLPIGRTRYALSLDEAGVVIDDGVVTRLGHEHFYVTTTTGASSSVYRELLRLNQLWRLDVGIVNTTGSRAAINIAGPRARSVLGAVTELDLSQSAFPYLGAREARVAGAPAWILRVGFVGELGYEIHTPSDRAGAVWDALIAAGAAHGIRPFGVEAQRVLRLEKGHLIIGQDTDGLTNPFEAGLGWAVRMEKKFFVGQRSLRLLQKRSIKQQLVGFTLRADPAELPEPCCLAIDRSRIAGRLTSIGWSDAAQAYVGLAYLDPVLAKLGARFSLRNPRGNLVEAQVTPTPFYDPENARQRVSDAAPDGRVAA
jgi:sarcosine oxidase subunit alpha